ncbi:cytochrome P450, family 6, subfamily ab, polypeptide 5 [Bombyx mori]|uniref:unspecific monooxygenase n=1 Tax=Bombyx mori TaxID=7091 RepID=A5JTS8_BOMMO|nr:cytochrome P450, family 6, subfamily ab, polypeptide 5 [Bombyx mori]ABQ45551.1 cytochrome P450 [Bombyx mori]
MFFYLLIVILVALYYYGIRTFDYWKKKGVNHDPPLPFFGNNIRQFMQKASMAMMATETYKKYPEEKVVGFYRGTSPELVVRDPELIKRILVTDFSSFYARGFNPHKKVIEPLLKNLFFADGDLWRLIRQRFTPAFSTAKLKAMFHIITERAEKLQMIAENEAYENFCDVRELMARYTTDFIGACGFGLNIDSLSDENSQFRKLGKRIFKRDLSDAVRAALKLMFPELCKHLTFLTPELEKSMTYLVQNVIREKNYKPSGRNDFIDLMLELKQKGKLLGESIEAKNANGTPKQVELEFDDLLMTAQVFVFFGAGFETSSTASSYTLHQLAFNPKCQEKTQKEIDKVLSKHNNKITYDAIKEMTYLEMAFNEAMRLYPSVGYLVRMCTVPEYTFPEINLTINEDVKLMIPIQAIHKDEKYFKDPERFHPERFSSGAKANLKPYTFLPFGEGPRACVGERLGQMLSMAGLVAVLQKYTVEPVEISLRDPIPDPTTTVSEGFVHGLPLKLRRRERRI